MQTALGLRTHSGWAAMVAIALSPEGPVVCDRRMVILCDIEIPGSKQPYHAAEALPIEKAKIFLKRCTDSTFQMAVASLTAEIEALRTKGHEVVGCGMTSASGRMPDSVEAVLASHAAIHTAEGELYRNAIARACEMCDVPLTRVREKDAFAIAEKALALKRKQIEARIHGMGKTVGSPWTQDQKLATLAAWMALKGKPTAKRTKAAGKNA